MYREMFPDVRDERPRVIRVRFDNHPKAIDRGVLATADSLRIGDRLYVNVAGYGHDPEWVATQITGMEGDDLVVKRL